MRNNLTTLLLIILVALSLILTYQLWYGQQPADLVAEDVFERIVVERPRPLDEVFHPAYVLIKLENGFYMLEGNTAPCIELWTLTREMISLSGEQYRFVEEGDINESISILTFQFMPPLPLGPDSLWSSAAPAGAVDYIDILTNNNGFFLALGGRNTSDILLTGLPAVFVERLMEKVRQLELEELPLYEEVNAAALEAVSDRNIVISEPLYLPAELLEMQRVNLQAEELDRELLLKTFFVDFNLARVIEERDGGLIYTDGEKGLRLTTTGLEFSNPRLEDAQVTFDYDDALASSNNFISYHGGWPAGLKLESLQSSGWGGSEVYIAQWRMYANNFPLFTATPTKMIFNDRGLVHYSRSIYFARPNPEEGEPELIVASWQEALDAAVNLYEEDLPGAQALLRLDTMRLGYAVLSSGLDLYGEPAWHLRINAKDYYLKADTLTEISQGAMR